MTGNPRAEKSVTPALVAAIVAATLALGSQQAMPVRWRSLWPEPGPWRLIGRQESMRGGWPW